MRPEVVTSFPGANDSFRSDGCVSAMLTIEMDNRVHRHTALLEDTMIRKILVALDGSPHPRGARFRRGDRIALSGDAAAAARLSACVRSARHTILRASAGGTHADRPAA